MFCWTGRQVVRSEVPRRQNQLDLAMGGTQPGPHARSLSARCFQPSRLHLLQPLSQSHAFLYSHHRTSAPATPLLPASPLPLPLQISASSPLPQESTPCPLHPGRFSLMSSHCSQWSIRPHCRMNWVSPSLNLKFLLVPIEFPVLSTGPDSW